MRCCINAVGLTEYASLNLGEGRSALEYCVEHIQKLQCPTLLIADSSFPKVSIPSQWQVAQQKQWGLIELLDWLQKHSSADEQIIYLSLDAPFVDPQLIEKMLEIHRHYVAEFTFADGYPQGLTVEIINSAIMASLTHLCRREEQLESVTMLFDIIQRDINAFDVETELSPVDLRDLRLSLRCNSRHNYLICKELVARKAWGSKAIIDTLATQPQLLRQLPAFVSVEVVAQASQEPAYLPYQILKQSRNNIPAEMPSQSFKKFLEQLATFAPQATLHISLWGEVALHSDPLALINMVRQHSLTCMVESSGVGWKAPELAALKEGDFDDVTWIVALDSNDPTLYKQLRGEGYEEAQRFAHSMLERYPQRTYVQMVRMQQSEAQLEHFYNSWKEKTENIIIMKYDHYCGMLPDLRVTDISPVKRRPCWHIKRDLSIMVDGSVPMCREDLHLKTLMGNIYHDSLETIWERGVQIYQQHIDERYPTMCAGCDEYYTYNA